MALKTGPLSADDLQAIWSAALDRTYRDALLRAGDGGGLEAHGQIWEQCARASLAIDRTTQAMFIHGWSGESDEPASGARWATVDLAIARTGFPREVLVLGAGLFAAEEATTDWGTNGPVDVLTGRRYALTESLVFSPGDMGAFTAGAEAERPGWGYNNPLPGTITSPVQVGSGLNSTLATVAVVSPVGLVAGAAASAILQTRNVADTLPPECVGQYVLFTAGSNTGNAYRIISYAGPDAALDLGAAATLEIAQAVEGTVFSGTFEQGEPITFTNGVSVDAYGVALGATLAPTGAERLAYVVVRGDFSLVVAGTVVAGTRSGASLTVATPLLARLPVAEASTASWRILDWETDWGLAVSNAASPEGGKAAMLDELGDERAIARAPGEADDIYSQRVGRPADVVSPNAIRRALSRTLLAVPWCFREVGSDLLPGFFFDGSNAPVGSSTTPTTAAQLDAYDTDVILFVGVVSSGTFQMGEPVVLRGTTTGVVSARGYFGRLDTGDTVLVFVRIDGSAPASLTGLTVVGLTSGAVFTPASSSVPATVNERRFHVLLSYEQFRAFFLVGVPLLSMGEFGFGYDLGGTCAYDLTGTSYLDAYDGYPVEAWSLYARVKQAVDEVRAGAVTFDLYVESIGCS